MNTDSLASGGPDERIANATGLQVRRHYIEQKSALSCRRYRPNPKWDTPEFWTEVGSTCISIGARPDLYVQAQFDLCEQADGPFPNALKGKGAARRYSSWIRSMRAPQDRPTTSDMAVDTGEVEEACRRAVEDSRTLFPDRPMREAMSSHATMTPAWLRILLCPSDEEVLSEFGERGASELLGNPTLQRQCQAVGLPVALTLREALGRFPNLNRMHHHGS